MKNFTMMRHPRSGSRETGKMKTGRHVDWRCNVTLWTPTAGEGIVHESEMESI